jgi:hypothetical protein
MWISERDGWLRKRDEWLRKSIWWLNLRRMSGWVSEKHFSKWQGWLVKLLSVIAASWIRSITLSKNQYNVLGIKSKNGFDLPHCCPLSKIKIKLFNEGCADTGLMLWNLWNNQAVWCRKMHLSCLSAGLAWGAKGHWRQQEVSRAAHNGY